MKKRRKILALLRSYPNLADRLWPRVLKHPGKGCWEWQGYTERRLGYGVISIMCYPVRVHTVAYFLKHGTLPRRGRELDHTCRNRKCVRHLEDVTHKENMRRGISATKTHCKHGHKYTPENTLRCNGVRYCRQCSREKATRIKRARGVLPRAEWFAKRLAQPKYSKQQKEAFKFTKRGKK